jgi:hypothetical protein
LAQSYPALIDLASSRSPRYRLTDPSARTRSECVLPLILKLQYSAGAERWIFEHHIDWDARVLLGRAA